MWPVRLWNVTEFHWRSHHNNYEMSDVKGRELLLTSGTFDKLYQFSFACELVGSIRASSSTFLFVLSTLISFFSFFLPFHFRVPRPSFLPFCRASSFFFLFLVSLFFESGIGRKLTKALVFTPEYNFLIYESTIWGYASDKCWWTAPLNCSALILYFIK